MNTSTEPLSGELVKPALDLIGLAKLVARCVRSPPDRGDGTRQRRVMQAPFAVQPQPRRRAVEVEVAQCRACGGHIAKVLAWQRRIKPLYFVDARALH